MTNLSSDRPKWRQRFSRERVLIGAPVVAGLLTAVALAIIDGKPRLGEAQRADGTPRGAAP